MKIYVKKSDITQGVRGDCKKCPIGLALNRKFLMPEYSVRYNEIRIKEKWIKNCKKVRGFVARFDRDLPVKPFNFVLRGL